MPNRTLSIKTMLVLVPLALILLACRASGPPASKPPPTPHPTSTSPPGPQPTSTFSLPTPPSISADLVASLEESTTDILGLYETSPDHQEAMDAGLRVVNVPELDSFFGLWIPDGYDQQEVHRVIGRCPWIERGRI